MRNKRFDFAFLKAARAAFQARDITLMQLAACVFISRDSKLLEVAEEMAAQEAMSRQLVPVSEDRSGIDWDSLAEFLAMIIPLIVEALLALLPLFFQKRLLKETT